MTELRRRLIALYALAPAEDVHATAEYRAFCEEHAGDQAFDGERYLVQRVREQLDMYLETKKSYRDQIEFALRLLRKLKLQEEQDVARELILLTYATHWEASQRQYFLDKSTIMVRVKHYFLSFTNRNPGKPNLNVINRDHEHFIIDSIGAAAYAGADLSAQNLLAEAIYHLLNHRQLDGFYYPAHEGDNRVVQDKLRENCERSLAFVQLVQGEMFRFYRDGNWCHYEYKIANDTDADRLLFVSVEETITDEDINPEFDTWYKRATTQDSVKLKSTRWHNPADIDYNRAQIFHNLKSQIDRSVNRIYQNIPN